MGLIGAAFGLGFIFGPSIGGLLSPYGYSIPPFFASGLALANGFSAIFLLPESRPKEIATSNQHAQRSRFDLSNLKEVFFQPKLRIYIFLFFLVTFSFANLEATFALLTERMMSYGPKENGYLFTFIGLVVAVVQGGVLGISQSLASLARVLGPAWADGFSESGVMRRRIGAAQRSC